MISKDYLQGEPFLLHLGDNLLEHGVSSFVKAFETDRVDTVIGITKVGNPERYGIVEFEDDTPSRILEKPVKTSSNSAIIGVYVFSSSIFDAIQKLKPSPRGEMEITDALEVHRREGRKIKLHRFSGWWKDAGTPADFIEANKLMLDKHRHEVAGKIEEGATVSSNITVGAGSVIKSGARILGPSIIGEACTIGTGAIIGPYVCIGDGGTIYRAKLRDSIVMNRCNIDVDVSFSSSIIGNDATVKSGPFTNFLLGDECSITL